MAVEMLTKSKKELTRDTNRRDSMERRGNILTTIFLTRRVSHKSMSFDLTPLAFFPHLW